METIHDTHFQRSGRMDQITSDSIDLVVTSPPYPMIEMWDASFSVQNPAIAEALAGRQTWRAFELMHGQLDPVWAETYRILKPGGIACINVGDAVRSWDGQFALFPNHARILERLIRIGFGPLPAVIWRKPTNAPTKFMGSGMLPPCAYVTLEHEMILIVRKGGRRIFDSSEATQRRRQSAYFWEERNLWFSDVWMDVKGAPQQTSPGGQRQRSGAYPFEIPWRLILMFSVIGDTVVDPFMGTGTTHAAAAATARNSIGFEMERQFENAVVRQLHSAIDKAAYLARKRLRDHLDFVQRRIEDGYLFKHINRHYGFWVMTRQETELCILQPTAVDSIGSGRYKAVHAPASLP